jgi:hypothetical protein
MLSEVAEALVRQGWHVVLPSRRYSPLSAEEPRPGAAASRALRPPGHVRERGGSALDAPETRDADDVPDAAGAPGAPGVGNVPEPGRALWVEASWDCPHRLADKAEVALGGPVDLLVSWVHGEYRLPVMQAVERLLAETAPVVEVHAASRGGAPVETGSSLPANPTQVVLLGNVSEHDETRSPSHGEIADGVLEAVRRALGGHPASAHQIGYLRPMVR